ncbi:type II secretion system F family protein [Desulfurobacterium sp. TC5-1]|uniref:type II secretion system F family protein n=1 Tax=Desulfurobacterium sp. TC5-1 TaxID=1158318 RepID=UPI0003B40FC4|nr:type II secretion system F family protein [Desulfurobacterium sp. TC5-1]
MAVFEYKAYDSSGKEVKGKEEALSEEQLRQILEKQGLIPFEIVPAGKVKRKRFSFSVGKKISDSDISLILYEMGTLFDRGIHITDVFEILANQFRGTELEEVFLLSRSKVAEGMSVGEAMREAGIFPDFVVEMVLAGEESGALGKVLISASKFLERETDFKEKIKGALTYPAIVVVIGFISMIVVMKVAVPKIVKIYTQFNEEIPLSTRIIMGFSSVLSLLFKLLIPAGILILLFKEKIFTRQGMDRLKLKIPLFRNIQLFSIYSSWAGTLSILLSGGLTLDEAVVVANKTISNSIIVEKFKKLPEWIREGKRMSEFLSRSKALPDAAVRLVVIGEETGELEEMLSLVSSIYRKETEKLINRFITLLEPATLLVLAVFVAFFVFATILPIFNLSVR